MHPSRIVVGLDEENEKSRKAADRYVEALMECIEYKDVPVLKMSFCEAESVKLFSNTYLAMRVAFFTVAITLRRLTSGTDPCHRVS